MASLLQAQGRMGAQQLTRSVGTNGFQDEEPQAEGPVLLLEDSMIIAMDAEDMLEQIGFENVIVESNVAGALAAIERERPRLAFLDFNLGEETSSAVADRLHELGIPFWFVTGYGEAMGQLCATRSRGVLQKPYTKEDFARAVAELEGDPQ